MILPSSKPHASRQASALVLAIFIVAVLAVFLGVAFDYTSNTSIEARRGQDLTAEQSMAEGALEAAFATWKNYMVSHQNLVIGDYTDSSDFVTLLSPLITKFNTTINSSNYVVTGLVIEAMDRSDNPLSDGQSTSTWTMSPSAVPGWIGTSYTYRAKATVAKWLNKAAGTKDPSSSFTIARFFETTDCSLFQAMMFFQNDLELNTGTANMTVSGLVATNSNLYLSTRSTLTFKNNVSFHGIADKFSPATKHPSNAIYDATGYAEGVTQTLYNTEKLWDSFNNPSYAVNKNTQLTPNVPTLDPLGMSADLAVDTSNPNTTGTHEIIERPVPTSKTNPNVKTGTTDPVTYAAHRLYNSAGLRIFINRGSSTPVSVYTPSTSNPENSVAANAVLTSSIAGTITPDTSSGVIYDYRETSKINASTVDMSKLAPILNTYPNYNGVVYIADVTNMDSNGESGNTDAIRISKGGVLPTAGLTLVSDGAVYVQGDYNTGTTYKTDGTIIAQPASDTSTTDASYTVPGYTAKPAAVMGDAVMILSNSWSDANSGKDLKYRTATPTTFNAALVTGQKLTTSDSASGGAHNLPRFLEDWSGVNFAYHGSMVELYESKHFNGDWGTQNANIYGPPNRNWFFETSYITSPPPGNLRSTTYVRGRWVRS